MLIDLRLTKELHGGGDIPEVPDTYIESLVRRVDRSRLRFEIGDPSTGPSIRRSQDLAHELKHAKGSCTFLEAGQTHNVTHFVPDPSQEEVQHQAISLDTGPSEINTSKVICSRTKPTFSNLSPIRPVPYILPTL